MGLGGQDVEIINSVVAGDLSGPGARFTGTFNLKGSSVQGVVNFEGALFREDFVARGAVFAGEFSALSGQFRRLADFGGARFESGTVFADVLFLGPLNMTGVILLGSADFRLATVNADASFRFASLAIANFEGASFLRDADFLEVGICAGSKDPLALTNFRALSVGGELVLRRALIGCALNLDSVELGALDTREIGLASSVRLLMNGARIDQLRMDLETSRHIVVDKKGRTDDRSNALEAIATSAEADGDLSTANRARFEELQIRARELPWYARWFVISILETLLGYFLRPSYPLTALLVIVPLVAISQLVLRRVARPRWQRKMARRTDVEAAAVFSWRALWRPWKGASSPPVGSPRSGRILRAVSLFERALIGVVLAAALTGIARTVPVAKEVIDAIT